MRSCVAARCRVPSGGWPGAQPHPAIEPPPSPLFCPLATPPHHAPNVSSKLRAYDKAHASTDAKTHMTLCCAKGFYALFTLFSFFNDSNILFSSNKQPKQRNFFYLKMKEKEKRKTRVMNGKVLFGMLLSLFDAFI